VLLITQNVPGFTEGPHAGKKLPELVFSPPLPPSGHFNLVISSNILSQLILQPYALLKKRFRWVNDEFFVRLSQKMGDDHLRWLQSFKGAKRLLISDVERIYFDRDAQEVERAPSSYRAFMGRRVRDWEWQIAPL